MTNSTRFAVALCGWALFTTTGMAQYPGSQFGRGPTPFSRPTVSPYLNLLQNGNPAINYYGLVRPQIAYDRALQNLGVNINALGNNLNSLDAGQPTQTGHRSSFMTQGQYFMTNGATGANMYGNQRGFGAGGSPGQYSGQNYGGYGGAGSGQTGMSRTPSAPGVTR